MWENSRTEQPPLFGGRPMPGSPCSFFFFFLFFFFWVGTSQNCLAVQNMTKCHVYVSTISPSEPKLWNMRSRGATMVLLSCPNLASGNQEGDSCEGPKEDKTETYRQVEFLCVHWLMEWPSELMLPDSLHDRLLQVLQLVGHTPGSFRRAHLLTPRVQAVCTVFGAHCCALQQNLGFSFTHFSCLHRAPTCTPIRIPWKEGTLSRQNPTVTRLLFQHLMICYQINSTRGWNEHNNWIKQPNVRRKSKT